MKSTCKIIAIGLGLFISTIGYGQMKLFSLEEAKAHALEHHIDVINSQRNIEIAQQQIVETRGMDSRR